MPQEKTPTIAVIGASSDRAKYSNRAVRAYQARGYTVFPINPRETAIEGLAAYPSIRDVPGPVDRVTVYVPPDVLLTLLPEIAEKAPAELYFNPGSERDDVVERARALGLDPILACSITAIGFSPRQFA
jgi:predicted CoA-binding protein